MPDSFEKVVKDLALEAKLADSKAFKKDDHITAVRFRELGERARKLLAKALDINPLAARRPRGKK